MKHWTVAVAVCGLSVLGFAQHYQQTNLVSNQMGQAPIVDPNLQNPWGLVHGPGTPWWVSDNADGLSTLYDGQGNIQSLVVTVPAAPGQPAGSPSAVMFNGSPTNFAVAPGHAGIFLWVTEDGIIAGWNPGVKPTTAITVVDRSQQGAVYKGATIVEIGDQEFMLVANFRTGRIEAYDSQFKRVELGEERFEDDRVPDGFAPFNVQGIGPNVYVTYAKQDAAKHDPVGGTGFGFVDVFSSSGRLLQRLEHGPWLNAPWGVVLAPADFGQFSHALLVGNFRGGTIAAYNPLTGRFLGNVLNPDGTTLNIDGLWALEFGNGGRSGPGNTMFFTAGPDHETNGLFGTLTPVKAELNLNARQ